MQPKIEMLEEKKLIGQKLRMSLAHNKTGELWRSFMPRRGEIKNPAGPELFSVEVFGDPDYFRNFDPAREFEKWAAVAVADFETVPEGMESLIVPAGLYAVFHYKGRPSEAQPTFQYIYGQWLPASGYLLDNRPHLAVMGAKYKGEDPESEEDLWIPVQKK